MIGYLKPAHPGPAQQRLFRAYQCALCHTLGEEYGFVYRLFAGPDLVFFNLFADLASVDIGGEAEPAEGCRACVLNPLGARGKQLPVMQRTEHTRLAAAFGVYMSVEKLKDDFLDEGGTLKWLAWRTLTPGWRKARTVLLAQHFPVQDVEAQMAEQARLERETGEKGLLEASAPTRAISRLLFSFPGTRSELAGQLGDRIGAYLFYMDNLLDVERDRRVGGYNAILRAGEGACAQALAGAHDQVDALRALCNQLPFSDRGLFVRQVALGFHHKLARFEGLTERQRSRATLGTLDRPAWSPGLLLQLKVAMALVVAFFFPRSVWATDTVTEAGTLTDAGMTDVDRLGTSLLATGDTGLEVVVDSSTGGGEPGRCREGGLCNLICHACVVDPCGAIAVGAEPCLEAMCNGFCNSISC